MRRLVALFVVALVGAALYGLSGASSGLTVNNQRVSGTTLQGELAAISQNSNLQCYITALNPTNYAPGEGTDSIAAAGAAGWSELRVEGVVVDQYVTAHYHYHPDAAQLRAAKASLESEMTAQATANSLTCPSTSSAALAAMPAEMRTVEIEDQATSLYFVAKLRSAIPLTPASIQSFYNAHVADYDTLCVSVALVAPANLEAFAQAQAAGMSVAQLAMKYSADTASASKGGAYGCVPPTNSAYTSVRSDVAGLALNTFSTSPIAVNESGTQYGLFVAVTKRTTTPFASAEQAVLADLQDLNASSANSEKDQLFYAAAIHVDPAFGRWGQNTNGPGVFVLAAPTKRDVTGASKLVVK